MEDNKKFEIGIKKGGSVKIPPFLIAKDAHAVLIILFPV